MYVFAAPLLSPQQRCVTTNLYCLQWIVSIIYKNYTAEISLSTSSPYFTYDYTKPPAF